MRGKVTLNYDGKDVFLDVGLPDDDGVPLKLSARYKTPEIAAAMAAIIAHRMGLRKRGSGWHKRTR